MTAPVIPDGGERRAREACLAALFAIVLGSGAATVVAVVAFLAGAL